MQNITWTADPDETKAAVAIYEETSVGFAKARIIGISESQWAYQIRYLPASTQHDPKSIVLSSEAPTTNTPSEPTLQLAVETVERKIKVHMDDAREKAELTAASNQKIQQEIQEFIENQQDT